MILTVQEKEFLAAAATLVKLHKNQLLSKEDLADNLIAKYEELDMETIRAKREDAR